MYYNQKTKEIKSHNEVKRITGASFPASRIQFNEWHLIDERQAPDALPYHLVVGGEIVKDGERYVRRWIQKPFTDEERKQHDISVAEFAVGEIAEKLQASNHWMLADYQASRSKQEVAEKIAKRKEWLDQLNNAKKALADISA